MELAPEAVILDAGYDGKDNYEGIYYEFHANPIIDIWDFEHLENSPTFNKKGVPYCLGRKLMGYLGSNEEGYIYRCSHEKCHLQNCKGVHYCDDVVTIPPEDDLRRVGPVARVSKEYKTLYNKRSSVERVNSRLKETRRLEDFRFSRIKKVTIHCLLSVLTMQAAAVAHVRAGQLENLRQCVRKVA